MLGSSQVPLKGWTYKISLETRQLGAVPQIPLQSHSGRESMVAGQWQRLRSAVTSTSAISGTGICFPNYPRMSSVGPSFFVSLASERGSGGVGLIDKASLMCK